MTTYTIEPLDDALDGSEMPDELGYREMDTDILLLAAEDRERAAKERLRAMTPDEWRDLRQACIKLDDWLDDIILEHHQSRNRKGVKNK